MYRKLLLLTFVVLSCKIGTASVFDWIWGEETDNTNDSASNGVPLISIPYESVTEDEKFLQEAAKFTEIQMSSPLETCQHKVVMKIRTKCSDMTEEQLAKLSVNLLNCQSAVEGRRLFPCTEEMSLQQCTMNMDADTWNAYHLMSNRARAVCYAARSIQFRALTELTVNKLMDTAHTQIQTLSSLKQSQDRLEEQTLEALSSLSAGNKELLVQQKYMQDVQITAHQLVTTNLRELNNEKALIRSGHAQLAAMTEDIKNKLEKAHEDLEKQSTERGENHREILEDLIKIQEQAKSIWEKVELTTNNILKQHEDNIAQYQQTLQQLTKIHDTVQYIWNLTNAMRTEVDEKLGWITDYIGDAGEQVHRVYYITIHILYILIAMIVAAFLHAPFLTRATIIGIVPVNLGTYLKHGVDACLNLTSMTVLIFLITGMHFVMARIQHIFGPKYSEIRPINVAYQNGNGAIHECTSSYTNSVPKMRLHTKLMKKLQELYNRLLSQLNYGIRKISAWIKLTIPWLNRKNSNVREELSCSYQPSKRQREDVVHEFHLYNGHDYDGSSFDDDITDAEELKRSLHILNSPRTRSVTPSILLCEAVTKSGKKCRQFPLRGRSTCFQHASGSSVISGHYKIN